MLPVEQKSEKESSVGRVKFGGEMERCCQRTGRRMCIVWCSFPQLFLYKITSLPRFLMKHKEGAKPAIIYNQESTTLIGGREKSGAGSVLDCHDNHKAPFKRLNVHNARDGPMDFRTLFSKFQSV